MINHRVLRPWMELIVVRAMSQSKLGNTVLTMEQLDEYLKFLQFVSRLDSYVLQGIRGSVGPTARLVVLMVFGMVFRRLIPSRILSWTMFAWYMASIRIKWTQPRNDESSDFQSWSSMQRGMGIDRNSKTVDILGKMKHQRFLYALSSREATKPLDMSFGLHAILKLFAESGFDVPSVNYSLPVSKAYQDLARFIITQTQSLDILPLAASNSCPQAASWVRDFSDNSPIIVWKRSMIGGNQVFESFKSSHESQQPRFGASPIILIVKGFQIETIVACKRFYATSAAFLESEQALHKHNLEMFRLCFTYSDGDLYERIVLGSNTIDNQPFAQIGEDIFNYPDAKEHIQNERLRLGNDWWELWNEMCTRVAGSQSPQDFADRMWEDMKRPTDLESRLALFHFLTSNILACINFKLIETETGLLGFAFGEVQEQDNIYLISGGNAPLIMRTVGYASKLVSSCILHCKCMRRGGPRRKSPRQRHCTEPCCRPVPRRKRIKGHCSCFEDDSVWESYIAAAIIKSGKALRERPISQEILDYPLPDIYIH